MDDSDALLPTLDVIRDLATVNLRVRSKLEDSSRALTPKASALPGGEGNLVLTDAGSLSGTPFYLAPELRFSPSASPQVADMFSFGVLAYELLTNKKPFQEPVIYQSIPDSTPLSFSSGLDALDALILRCLSFEPKERPTAHELNIELQGLVELVAVSPTI